MGKTYEGRCHCGQTTWTAEIDNEKHVLCHCCACKLLSGGEFTLNSIIPLSAFKLTKGNLNKYTYKGDSGNDVDCFYCPNCTSSPYHHQKVLGDNIVIRTGLLKGSEDWGKPALEIFDALRPSWLPQTGDNSVKGPPPS